MFGIPTPQTLAAKALCYLVGALILTGAGAYGGYRFEKSEVLKIQLADANAMKLAVQVALRDQNLVDARNLHVATLEAYAQGKLDGVKFNLTVGVPNYVTPLQDKQAAAADTAGCITYGFYRVLAAGQRGVSAENLPLPGAESNDACTAESPSSVAATIAGSLVTGVQNAEQLNALEGDIADTLKIVGQGGNKPAPLEPVKSDMAQPNGVRASDRQASPPGQREADNGIKPQVIDAPSAEKRGWEPVDASKFLAAADRPDVQDGEAGGAKLKGGLGEIRIHGGTLPSIAIMTATQNSDANSIQVSLALMLPLP